MALKSLPASTVAVNNVRNMPDIAVDTPTNNKTKFDQYGIDDVDYINNTFIPALQDTTVDNSGAHAIGFNSSSGTNDNVGDQLETILQAGSGTIPPDGTISNAKLATDVKVGSLATLTTTEKSSVVGAINEVDAQIDGLDVLTTQGDILYRDGSGYARLAAGTSGQVLKTNGAGANPSWGEDKGGAYNVITSGTTQSDGILSFSSLDLDTYSEIVLILSEVLNTTANYNNLGIRVNNNTGSIYSYGYSTSQGDVNTKNNTNLQLPSVRVSSSETSFKGGAVIRFVNDNTNGVFITFQTFGSNSTTAITGGSGSCYAKTGALITSIQTIDSIKSGAKYVLIGRLA